MLSVIFSSHNGGNTLPLTLDAFMSLECPAQGVEFIAVDNASTDDTSEILSQYKKHLNFKVLFEPRRGKSYAVNTAIQNASGDLFVFTDDDVLPEPNWLIAFAEYANKNPQASIFAGQVRHYWESTPLAWLEQLAIEGRSFAGTAVTRSNGPLTEADIGIVKGTNFMIRREILQEVRFCENEGINFTGQSSSPGGEDTDFVQRALQNGYKLHYRGMHLTPVHFSTS